MLNAHGTCINIKITGSSRKLFLVNKKANNMVIAQVLGSPDAVWAFPWSHEMYKRRRVHFHTKHLHLVTSRTVSLYEAQEE
jgi:hypothetical protein